MDPERGQRLTTVDPGRGQGLTTVDPGRGQGLTAVDLERGQGLTTADPGRGAGAQHWGSWDVTVMYSWCAADPGPRLPQEMWGDWGSPLQIQGCDWKSEWVEAVEGKGCSKPSSEPGSQCSGSRCRRRTNQ